LVSKFGSEPGGGLVVLYDIFTSAHRSQIIELASRYRLPAIYPIRIFADDGGLLSYGTNPIELFREAASYVDRIPKGKRAGDLPIQEPTKIELVINLKTAKALGLAVAAITACPGR
jgi:putative ABC transport system substrate-binding protein